MYKIENTSRYYRLENVPWQIYDNEKKYFQHRISLHENQRNKLKVNSKTRLVEYIPKTKRVIKLSSRLTRETFLLKREISEININLKSGWKFEMEKSREYRNLHVKCQRSWGWFENSRGKKKQTRIRFKIKSAHGFWKGATFKELLLNLQLFLI